MRHSYRFAVLVCAGLLGCGAPESKPPAGAESSETKLEIEFENGDAKPTPEEKTATEKSPEEKPAEEKPAN